MGLSSLVMLGFRMFFVYKALTIQVTATSTSLRLRLYSVAAFGVFGAVMCWEPAIIRSVMALSDFERKRCEKLVGDFI